MKRATFTNGIFVNDMAYFNPRPREEGDSERMRTYAWGAISIHALVKRATPQADIADSGRAISIHALVKRATTSARPLRWNATISIHALVKRATKWLYDWL